MFVVTGHLFSQINPDCQKGGVGLPIILHNYPNDKDLSSKKKPFLKILVFLAYKKKVNCDFDLVLIVLRLPSVISLRYISLFF